MSANIKCLHCGESEKVELLEVWGSEFMLSTCCEGLHESIVDNMQNDPDYRVWLLRELQADALCGYKLRRVAECDGQFLLDWNPEIREIQQRVAKDFVNEHHAHNRAPAGWKFGAGIWNGGQLIGVVMVGRPVARKIDAKTTVEVNRLCIRRDVPSELVWNACSLAYGWAAREARARGFGKIITYTLEIESGTALRAVGWAREAVTQGGSWNRPSREREDTAPICRKVRWAKVFAKKPAGPRHGKGKTSQMAVRRPTGLHQVPQQARAAIGAGA